MRTTAARPCGVVALRWWSSPARWTWTRAASLDVCRRFLDDTNRALVWFIRSRAQRCDYATAIPLAEGVPVKACVMGSPRPARGSRATRRPTAGLRRCSGLRRSNERAHDSSVDLRQRRIFRQPGLLKKLLRVGGAIDARWLDFDRVEPCGR